MTRPHQMARQLVADLTQVFIPHRERIYSGLTLNFNPLRTMKTTRPFNRSRVLAFTLLFGALALSCSDDFVYVNSENQNSETYFNTEEDYQNALIGAYDMLQSSYINVMLGEIASANTLAGGESATDVIGIQQIDDMIHTPTNEQLRSIWSWMYAGS